MQLSQRAFGFFVLIALVSTTLARGQDSQPTSRGADAAAAFRSLEDELRARIAKDIANASGEKGEWTRQQALIDAARNRVREYLPRYERLAEAARGQSIEIAVLERVMDLGQQTDGAAPLIHDVLEKVRGTALDQPELEDVLIRLRFLAWLLPEAEILSFMDLVARRSPLESVRAAALFHASVYEIEFKDPPLEKRAAIKARLEGVIRDYPKSNYAGLAPAYIFDLTHLQVGMAAPDLAVTDGGGREFRLSECRGRTTVLCFWSIRSRASLDVVDHLNRLYAEIGPERLTIFGIVADAKRDDQSRIENAGVRFRNALEGDSPAPTDRAWNVYAWPMVFVIDADGVIRKRHVQKAGLEEAVRTLTGMPASAPSPGK